MRRGVSEEASAKSHARRGTSKEAQARRHRSPGVFRLNFGAWIAGRRSSRQRVSFAAQRAGPASDLEQTVPDA
eukprot:483618-Rhodomonas_salina.1